jgi:hypothetical protein
MAIARKRTTTKVKAKPRTATKRVAAKSAKKAPRVSTHPVKKRTPVSLAIIEKLDTICLALPDATQQIAWGEPTWRVKGKIFAQLDDHHHGAEHVSVWLPAPDGAQEALIDSDPERFFRPPYVGHRGWIAVVLDTDPDWGMVASLVEQAHGMIAGARRTRA